MPWKIEFTPEAEACLEKMGTAEARRILKFLHECLHKRKDPREIGESLKGVLCGIIGAIGSVIIESSAALRIRF